MNNQLKLLLYIVFVVAVFLYIQDNFNFFDIAIIDGEKEKNEEEVAGADVVKKSNKNYVEINIPNENSIKVDVEIADNDVTRASGLSNRRYLGDYNGMLFIFEEKVNNPFWMKDTFINLDILFIDEFGFIIDIKENNEPCTESYCPQIFSSSMYKYVLEVNGGFCEINGINIGQSLVIHLASSR